MATPPTNDNDDGRLDQSIVEELAARARADGIDLVGPGGLLDDLTKQMSPEPAAVGDSSCE